jgi:protease IV
VEREHHPHARRLRVGAITGAVAALTVVAVAAMGWLLERFGAPATLIAALTVAAVLVAVALLAGRRLRRIPPRVVLELDLSEPLRDLGAGDPISAIAARRALTLRDAVDALEHAEADPRIVALFARIGQPATGLADVQELREAIRSFRASGRPAIAFAETFGEFSGANAAYQLATAFDEIHLQPSGAVGLTGPVSTVRFLRGTLEKLGVEPQLEHRHEYKAAKNRLTERSFTPAHREAADRIVASLAEQLVADVADGRGLTLQEARRLVDRAPLLAREALDAGLVDHLSYRDQALEHVSGRAGDHATLLPLRTYQQRVGRRRRRGTVVAFVHGSGSVVRGRPRPTPFGLRSLASDAVAGGIRAAIDDEDVAAILFRVDSPGGSYVASDVIWREVVRARDAGKPVVVSMGNVAGSGGYFVAMAADRILAHPATLTGSIGVVAGKALLRGARAKAGLSSDEVHRGANALMWSTDHPYGPAQRERLDTWLDHVYADFTSKAAEGRDLTVERVDEVARGRVWTGADAYDLGLVDELGGYRAATAAVRELLGLAEDAPIRLTPFPRQPSAFARLLGSSEPEPAGSVLGPLGDAAELARDLAAEAGVRTGDVLRVRGRSGST